MTDDLDKKLEEYKLEIEKAEKEERKRKAEEERKRKAKEELKRKAAEEFERKVEEERKRMAEEERKRMAEEERKRMAEEADKRMLSRFNSGYLAYNADDFEKVLKAGHTPTYASCGGNDDAIGCKDVIKLACEYGLSKDDATNLLQKCVSIDFKYIADDRYDIDRKVFIDKMKILIEQGHADVSKCSLSNIREIYNTVEFKDVTWDEHTGIYKQSLADLPKVIYDEVLITHNETIKITYEKLARDMFVLLLKSGYKPETLADKKDFVYLYTHVKDHIEKLEQEERKQQETKENFEKGIYYINLEEGKPVGKCKAPLNFTYDGSKFSMLSPFNDTFSSRAKEIENLEGIVDGNFGKDGFSGNITASGGDISLKVQYKDGKMHGVYKELDSDGTVIIEKYYENGVDVTEKHNALKRIAARKIKREEKLEGKKLPKAIKKIGKAGVKIDSKIQAAIAIRKAEKTE